jgi:hypothetical protein
LQREGLDSERTPSSALSQVSYTYDDVGRVIEAVNMNGTRIKTGSIRVSQFRLVTL